MAYDFTTLCDVTGCGAYSVKERSGSARSDRPDASLCEVANISKTQVSKMVKLLIAFGALKRVREASHGRQAVYQTCVPTMSDEAMGRGLAAAAELGFKPRAARDMSKANEARRARKVRREAVEILDGAASGPSDDL
ncbi:hypothetical protein AB0O47_39255, partial [Streptomyces noursei]